MKSLGFISQIATIGVAVVIAVFYVQPTVQEIGQIQSDIGQYQEEREKVQAVNARLANNVAAIDAISPDTKQLLATYMPPAIDDIKVMRDIGFIVESAGMTYTGISYEDAGDRPRFDATKVTTGSALGELAATPHTFTLAVEGTYEDLKVLLNTFEQNEYPLEISAMSISSGDDLVGIVADITLVTYAAELSAIDTNN